MFDRSQLQFGAFLIAIAALSTANAIAATSEQAPGAHATAFCQSALPAFEGLIRKRPLALQNEGTATAFVTCSVPSDLNARELLSLSIVFVNNTGGSVSISCTLVSGALGNVVYIPKATTGAGEYMANIWSPSDIGGNALSALSSFSCALPPGTGVHYLSALQIVEIEV